MFLWLGMKRGGGGVKVDAWIQQTLCKVKVLVKRSEEQTGARDNKSLLGVCDVDPALRARHRSETAET